MTGRAVAGAWVLTALFLVACSGGATMGDTQWLVRFSDVRAAPTLAAQPSSCALQIQIGVDRLASGERAPAPDGTRVEFGSTGGEFESGAATQQAWTVGGTALAVLRAGAPGAYDVTVRVEDTEGILHIEIGADGSVTVS